MTNESFSAILPTLSIASRYLGKPDIETSSTSSSVSIFQQHFNITYNVIGEDGLDDATQFFIPGSSTNGSILRATGGGFRDWNTFFKMIDPWLLISSIVNLIGNVTILCLIRFSPTFRKPANYLICNLSAASLLYMTTILIRRFEKHDTIWSYGPITCRVIPVLLKIPSSVISLTLMSISSDRSKIIRNPFDKTPRQDSRFKVLKIWILSIIIVLPYGIAKKFDSARPEHYKCIKVNLWGNPMYNILYGLIALFVIHIIPAIVLLFDVSKMLHTMKFLSDRKFLSLWPKQMWRNKDRRVTLMCNVIIYTCVFIFCWIPMGITRFPLDLPPGIVDRELRRSIQKYWESLKIISYIYVSVHPILLFLLSHDLRRKVTLCFV